MAYTWKVKAVRTVALVLCGTLFWALAPTTAEAQDRDTKYRDKKTGPAPVAIWVDVMPKSCPNYLDNNLYVPDPDPKVGRDDWAEAAAKQSTGWRRAVLDIVLLGNARADLAQIDPTSIQIECFSPVQVIPTGDAFTQPSVLTDNTPEQSCCTPGPDGCNDVHVRVDKVLIWKNCGDVKNGDLRPIRVTARLLDGTRIYGTDWVIISMDEEEEAPATTASAPAAGIGPCYPNPFNPSTSFAVTFDRASPYEVSIYNIAGQRVRTYTGTAVAGTRTFTWDGNDFSGKPVASGLYFGRLSTPELAATTKMLLVR